MDFYYRSQSGGDLRLIGSDGSQATSDDGDARSHTYELDVTGNELHALGGLIAEIPPGGTTTGMFYAFGVSKDGTVALVARGVDLDIDTEE